MITGLGIRRKVKNVYNSFRVWGKPKIFCIGLNKTGTTSLKKEMELQGYIIGNQRQAAILLDDYLMRKFSRIIRYCEFAEFFQDSPFSLPYTFIVMDHAFHGSKFILSVRNDSEEWYRSITRFHSKLWGKNGSIPTQIDLQNAINVYKGRPWIVNQAVFNTPYDNPYKKDVMIDYYETHNKNVRDYFRHRPKDLLIINLKEKDSYSRFCEFLDLEQKRYSFPWENKTDEK